MYAILYPKNETKFTTYGLGVIISSVGQVTTQRNGEYTIYMEIPQEVLDTYRYDQIIEVGMFLKAKAGIRRSLQTFEINRVVKSDDGALRIWGEHALLARLNADNIRPSVSVKGSADVALQALSDNLVSKKGFDVQSDIDTSNTANWTVDHFENAKEVLAGKSGSILDIWGGEYEFDNNLIFLHKRLGRKAPTALIYGRNITSIKQDERIDSTYTSVYPYAVYQDDKQKEHLVSIDNFVIDSDHVGKYQHRKIKTLDLSEKFKEHEVPTKEKLTKLTKAYIKSNSIGVPSTKLEIEYQDLSRLAEFKEFEFIEEIDICDVLPVFYPKIGVTDQDARVTEVVYDFINDQNKSIKIGTIGRSTSYTLSKTVQEQLDSLNSKQKSISEQLPYLIDGRGNRVWRTTPDPNIEHKIGDVWFDKNGKYTIIKIWDGKDWFRELDEESFQRRIDEQLKALESQANEANQKITESDQKADSILTGLGVKDIRSASREIANKLSSFATQKNIDESILNDKKVKDTRSDNQPPSWYWENYPYQVAREFKQRSTLGVEGSTNYGLLTTNVQYQDASGSNITQVFESADGTFRRRSEGNDSWTDWQREANEDYVNTLVTKENGLLRAEITALENGVYKKSDFSISPNKIQSAIDSLENDVYKKSDFKMTPDDIVASIVNISDDLSTNIYKKSDFRLSPEQIVQSIESTEQSATELTTKYNRISNSVESMQQIIGNKDNVARLVMGSSIYQTEISNLANPNILIDSLFTPFKRTTNYLFHSFDLASKMIDGKTYTIRIAGMIPDNKTSYRLYNSGGTVFLTDVSKSDRIGTVAVSTGITRLYEKTFVWRESYNGSATVDSKALRIYNYPSTVNGEMYVMWATLVEGNKGKNWQASQVELKNLSTKVTQLEDSWGVQIKSADDVVTSINATTKGLKFKGDLIDFDGLVNANKAIIKNAVMDSLVANDVTAYIGKFSKLVSTYIDAKSISGMNSEFIKSLWNGINSYVSITGDAIQINGYDGDRGITLGPKSMTFFSDTGEGARFINANMYVKDRYELYDTGQNAVGLSALERHNIWFGYYDPSEQIHRRLITINQENAKLIVHAPMFSHQSHYRAFQFDTGGYISNHGGGVALRNTAYGYAQLFMADDGSIYIRHSGTGNFVSWNELVDKVFPPSSGSGSSAVPDKSSTYKYDYPRAGEGFYRVAIRNGLTLNQLMALNPQYTIYSTITVNTRLRVG